MPRDPRPSPRTLTLAALALLWAPAAMAQAPCVKPGVPVCMDDTTTFVSAERMTTCQQEVREYIDRTMDYLRCLNEENAGTGMPNWAAVATTVRQLPWCLSMIPLKYGSSSRLARSGLRS